MMTFIILSTTGTLDCISLLGGTFVFANTAEKELTRLGKEVILTGERRRKWRYDGYDG